MRTRNPLSTLESRALLCGTGGDFLPSARGILHPHLCLRRGEGEEGENNYCEHLYCGYYPPRELYVPQGSRGLQSAVGDAIEGWEITSIFILSTL